MLPIQLYLDAIRHMRARQLVGRARRIIPPAILAAGLGTGADPSYAGYAAGLGADPAPSSGPAEDPATSGAFTAYGHSRPAPRGDLWGPGPEGLLFMFHLHGFSPLAAYAAGPRSSEQDRFWAGIVESWLDAEAHPSLPAWHPYPTSSRVIAWCSALGSIAEWPDCLRHRLAGEISRQARYLRRAVEHDIGGNHVLKNATALVFAGVTVPESGVLDFGLRLLERELAKQILTDGGHEERSTSYHREVSHDLSDVAQLLARASGQSPHWLERARLRTEDWQRALAGPDGCIPMLNDAWEGPPIERGSAASEPLSVLADSGYVVLRHGDDQAVIDCGRLAPAHLPAHAHADALSFVLWMDGRPVIADPGAYTYSGPEREEFRGTAAHGTVAVDGEDQCIFWGDFRASFLPRVEAPRVRECDGAIVVESSHDGYRRLADPVIHHRAFVWVPGDGLVLIDRLQCAGAHSVRSTLPLAPGLRLDNGRVGDLAVGPLTSGGSTAQEDSAYAPALGQRVRTSSIAERRAAPRGEPFGWYLLRDGASGRMISDRVVEISRRGGGERVQIRLSALG